MKHVFIINPSAGSGKITPEQIRSTLESIGADYEVLITSTPGDATKYVENVCNSYNSPVRFYACGGDGTIKEVADGVVKYPYAELSCYPIGTGNDFVKYYGGEQNFLDLEKLLKSESHHTDLIKVENEYSINVTNFGFEASVCETMIKVRRKFLIGGKNAYTTGIITSLFKSMKNKGKIYVDGELINPSGDYLLCTIANGNYVGGSYQCAPRAVTNDGYLEVCCVKPISVFKLLSLIKYYKQGTHLDNPKFKDILTYRKAKSITVKSEKEFSVTLDGEMRKYKEFNASIVHNAIKFAAPETPEKNLNIEKEENLKV